jgi:hypothetical protein
MSDEEMYTGPPETTSPTNKRGGRKPTQTKQAAAKKKKKKKVTKAYVPKEKFIEFEVDGQLLREKYKRAKRTPGVGKMSPEKYREHRRALDARRMQSKLYARRHKDMKSKTGWARYRGQGRGGRGTTKSPYYDREERKCALPAEPSVKSRCSRKIKDPEPEQVEACQQTNPCRKTVAARLKARRQRQQDKRGGAPLTGQKHHLQQAYHHFLAHKQSLSLPKDERTAFIRNFRANDPDSSFDYVTDPAVRKKLLFHAKKVAELRGEKTGEKGAAKKAGAKGAAKKAGAKGAAKKAGAKGAAKKAGAKKAGAKKAAQKAGDPRRKSSRRRKETDRYQ